MGETIIKAGSWLAVLQFNDDSTWEGVKNGDYTGVSIGGVAQAELLNEDNDD